MWFCGRGSFQQAHCQWVKEGLTREMVLRDERWEALAIGSLAFVDNVKRELGVKAMRREIAEVEGTYTRGSKAKLMRAILAVLTPANIAFWEENAGSTET